MLALALAGLLAAAPSAAGSVVVGVSTPEGTTTTLRVVAPDGAARDVAVVAHLAGDVPVGVIDGHHVLLTVPRRGGAATIERVSLDDGAAAIVGEDAATMMTPIPVAGGAAYVRAAPVGRDGPWDIVVARDSIEETVASIGAAWAMPVRGARALSLFVVDADGTGRFVEVDATRGVVRDVVALGAGPFHFPCGADSGPLLVELKGARVVDARTGSVLVSSSNAGLSPVCAPGLVAMSTGKKDGTLLFAATTTTGAPFALGPAAVGRAGIARPQAAALVDGRAVVVVRLDRGAALPAETWVVDAPLAPTKGERGAPARARRVAAPEVGAVVVVYGVVATGAAP